MRGYLLFIVLLCTAYIGRAQCPAPTLNTPDQTCLENSDTYSVDETYTSYAWDFCPGDLQNTPVANPFLETALSRAEAPLTLQDQDSNWFMFVPGLSSILRVNMGTTPGTLIDTTYIKGVEGINRAVALQLVYTNDNWYGFTVEFNSGNIYRLDFGNDLSNDQPTLWSLNTSTYIQRPRDLKLVEDSGQYYLVVPSTTLNTIQVIPLGNDITAAIDPDAIVTTTLPASSLQEITVKKICDEWQALAVAFGNDAVYYLNYSTDLLNTPTIEEVTPSGLSIQSPTAVQLAYDKGSYQALITTSGQQLYRLDFGSTLHTNPTSIRYTDLPVEATNQFGINLIKEGSTYYGYGINTSSGTIIAYQWPEDDCIFSEPASEEPSPVQGYSMSGTGTFDLTVSQADGHIVRLSEQVTVSPSPNTDIIAGERCAGSEVSLSSQPQTTQTITAYQWKVDGVEIGTQPDAAFTPDAAGTYLVSLEVTSQSGCTYLQEKSLVIQDPSELSPAFSITNTVLCSNTAIDFTDVSAAGAGEEVAAWLWDFGDPDSGTDNLATTATPTHVYASPGTYQVTLTVTSTSGCTATTSREITLTEGPEADFSFTSACQGQIITFSNESRGAGITSYFWDLGDGTTSTVENPIHRYQRAGTFTVSLTTRTANGCETSLAQQVDILPPPFVDFISESACSGSPTRLQDFSNAGSGNIVAWRWEISEPDTTTIYTEPSPYHTFTTSGPIPVKLVVTNNTGCSDSLTQNVNVLPGPDVAFDVVPGCPGEVTRFFDRSTTDASTTATSRLWLIDGRLFNEQNPEVVFSEPGSYEAVLIVEADNGCDNTLTQQVVIDPAPTLDFTLSGSCSGQPLTLNPVISSGEEIVSVNWTIQDQGTSTDRNPIVCFEAGGEYTITLTATTARGCSPAITRTVSISASPQADFTFFPTEGTPPVAVRFFNRSTGAAAYQWYAGETLFSTEAEPNLTITEEGEQVITLVAINADGCSDTLRRSFLGVDPRRDVALRSLALEELANGTYRLRLEVFNNSTLPVDSLRVAIYTDELSVSTGWSGLIAPNTLQTIIPDIILNSRSAARADYICVMVSQAGFTDISEDNNEECLIPGQEVIFMPPLPNPAKNIIRWGIINTQPEQLSVQMINNQGEVVNRSEYTLQPNNHTFIMEVSHLTPGMYYMQMQTKGYKRTFKIMVLR